MRSFLANLGLLCASIIFCLVCTEMLLRLSDSRWERERARFADNTPRIRYYQFAPGLLALSPSQSGEHAASCFRSRPVTVNSEGFRTVVSNKEAKIALLGDSFVEALQVPDGLTVADELSKAISLPVLNAGVSGYSTLAELLAWQGRVKPLHPRLLILFVYLGNDISGNSCALSHTLPPCGKVLDGKVVYSSATSETAEPYSRSAPSVHSSKPPERINHLQDSLRTWVRSHLAFYAVAHDAKMIVLGALAQMQGKVDIRWGLYRAKNQPLWDEAWRISEDALFRLKNDVESIGSLLVVVSIPEHIALATNPETLVRYGGASAFPDDFDAGLPSRRLEYILRRLQIPLLDMLPVFLVYRDNHKLKPPYFSYSCDGHWNPLGHALASDALARFLVSNHLIEGPSGSTQDMMSLPPEAILGDKAFRQIYEGGVYAP